MTVDEFLRTSPCLEELDGYLEALKPGSAVRASGAPLSHNALTPEVMKAVEDYRARMLKGKIAPAPTRFARAYTYRLGRAPA